MSDRQVSQPEADSFRYPQESQASVASWSPGESNLAAQKPNCRQVGNEIICDDIYGTKNSLSQNEAFRAVASLQRDLGLFGTSGVTRASDTQSPPYYPPQMPDSNYYQSEPQNFQSYDPFSFHQAGKPGVPGQPGVGSYMDFDPYSYHQNDQSPPLIPPYLRPNVPELPQVPVQPPRPGDQQPQPLPQPRTETPRPGNPCQPCRPNGSRMGNGNCGWFPGKIAGRMLGRVFGGRRCR